MARASQARAQHLLFVTVLLLAGPVLDIFSRDGQRQHKVAHALQATSTSRTTLPLSPENLSKGMSMFRNVLDNTYNLNGKFGVPTDQLRSLGVPEQYITAAETMRNSFRQSLVQAFDASSGNSSTLGDGQIIKELLGGTQDTARSGNAEGGILNSILRSEVPISVNDKGEPLVPALTAIGKWLGDRVRQSVSEQSGPGQKLEGLTNAATAGRKLMQVEEDKAPEGLDVVQAAEHDIKRIQKYLFHLAEVAEEVFQAERAEGDSTAEGAEGLDAEATQRRKLQQQDDGSYLGGYAQAFRLIFTNVFDLFRDFGLFGLTPIIADVRGLLTRFNWISDLFQIAAAPAENFINTNYFPLPQTNDDVIALVRRFFSDYCSYEEVTSSNQVVGSFKGPTFSIELVPVSCPIYSDPETGRNYISFADCDPAELVITTTPLEITEPYLSAASYTGTECKYTEVYGIDTEFGIGGGEQEFTFRRSAQGIDIVPTVVQVNSDTKFYNFEDDTRVPVEGGNVTLTREVAINRPATGEPTATDTGPVLTGTAPR